MNPYKLLGLHFDANQTEVKAAYRSLAKDCHPDLFPGDPEAAERFRALTLAYRTVMAELPRGSGRRRAEKRSGPARVTLRKEVVLTAAEAVGGCLKEIAAVAGPCPACRGRGRIRSEAPAACAACGGGGVALSRRTRTLDLRIECSDCGGTGRARWTECGDCGGFGTCSSQPRVVEVPAGTRPGDRITVPGGANSRDGDVAGDLELTIRVFDPRYRIEGDDIVVLLDLDVWQAVLGCVVRVRHPLGEVFQLEVPPDTPSGSRLPVDGAGMPGHPGGDLVAITRTRLPGSREPKVREAMELMRAASGANEGSNS